MIYPRNKSSASQSKTKSRRNFLNPYQREELKKRLVEKFTKLYGLNNPSIVKGEVNSFFKANNEINASNLRNLEARVKRACLNKKSLAKAPSQLNQGGRVNTNQRGYAQQGPNIVSHNARASREEIKLPAIKGAMAESKPLQGSLVAGSHLNYLSEEDEWAAINKYNTYLYNQEDKLMRMKILQKRRLNKAELDKQINEKERIAQMKEREKQSYISAEKKLLEYENEKESRKQKNLKEKMQFEKEMRELQMREIEERKRFDHEQEKTLDAYILTKIKSELAEEQREQAQKKHNKMLMMRQMMIENNERKKKLIAQQDQEKQEAIDLQMKAIAIGEEMEKQRAVDLKTRNDRIAAQLQSSEDKVQELKNKNYAMEMRNQRYQELREKCMKEKEVRAQMLREKRKNQLRHFLDKQVEEKQKKLEVEKKRNDEQAVIWRNEKNDYEQFVSKRNTTKAQTMRDYREQLKKQIADNEQLKKKKGMTNEEAALNRLLLQKVHQLHVDDTYLQQVEEDKKNRIPVMMNNVY